MTRLLSSIVVLALATPALANTGTLLVEKQGILPAFAWVDGRPVGKIKKNKPVQMALSPGWHEVWYAGDPDAVVTLCHGLVNVPNGGSVSALYRDRGCEGLTEGWPAGPSAFRGSEVLFKVDGELDAWVSIDGGQPYAFPDMPFMLNLAPGTHTFVLYTDVMQESVFDQGTVTLRGGERLAVTCTVAGCVGFDQPPVVMVEMIEAAPAIQLAIPNVSLDLVLQAGPTGARVDGVGVQMGITVDETTGAASVGVQVDDGMGGGVRMDIEASETGGSVNVEVDE